jgi:hypothetical protein
MWASTVPSPKGTSVMTRFIFTGAGVVAGAVASSRIFFAASTHSSVRNW